MEYSRWAPTYERIRAEFGFAMAQEAAAADELRSLLPASARERPLERIAARLHGRVTIVVGDAPGAGPPPLWRLAPPAVRPALLAADGATAACLHAGFVPDVIVSDLDGPVASEVTANHRGSLVVIHAHGDNRAALADWGREFSGELAGSWAGPPRDGLLDVGGFTDGDRGAFLAEHVGASRILLWGFDFTRVVEADERRAARKRAKLRWAAIALGELASTSRIPIDLWQRDGSRIAYAAAGSAAESTR